MTSWLLYVGMCCLRVVCVRVCSYITHVQRRGACRGAGLQCPSQSWLTHVTVTYQPVFPVGSEGLKYSVVFLTTTPHNGMTPNFYRKRLRSSDFQTTSVCRARHYLCMCLFSYVYVNGVSHVRCVCACVHARVCACVCLRVFICTYMRTLKVSRLLR